MPRPIWLRAFIAVWSLWLQGAILDPGSFDPCPEHAHHAVAAQIAGHASHMAHASHEHGAPGDHKAHTCTCLGACCCAPAAPLPATGIEAPLAVVAETTEPRHSPVRAIVALRPHTLPFANGPPSGLTA